MSTFEPLPVRTTRLGPLEIRRALPVRQRRMVGPWCFLDRYGPLSFSDDKPMDVAPHPHIGLQTVTWLLDGEVFHRDSIGSESMVRPQQLNVMTSGRGIAHSEETPRRNSGELSGVQLWVALPDSDRNREPAFEHHPELPKFETVGATVTLFAGEMGRLRSPATMFSPIIGADAQVHARETAAIPLANGFEHAMMLLSGDVAVGGQRLETDTLVYLGTGRDEITLTSAAGARVLLLGGAPFEEKIFMWWNFVARSAGEIAAAQQAWDERRIGEVPGYAGPRIEAPRFPAPVPANPAS
jgi:quercetin 2,3-dioxygenase